MAKQALTFADVEAQGAFELPSRELMGYLVKVTVGDITVLERSFNDLIDAQRFCVQVTLIGNNKCEITGGGGQHSYGRSAVSPMDSTQPCSSVRCLSRPLPAGWIPPTRRVSCEGLAR